MKNNDKAQENFVNHLNKDEKYIYFKEIIYKGYFTESTEALTQYFIREFKQAEKEKFYKVDDFFKGCSDATIDLYSRLVKKAEKETTEKKVSKIAIYSNFTPEIGYYLTYNDLDIIKDALTDAYKLIDNERADSNNKISKIELLKTVFLAEPKISVEQFLQKGIDVGIWNEEYSIITQKGSLYGTGKSLLGNLSIALNGWAISSNTDYKEIGKIFCQVFNIPIEDSSKEPFKAFSSGSINRINQLKRAFSIKNNS